MTSLHEASANELLPVVNFASRDAANAGAYWGPRIIPDDQLFYVASGEARLTVGGEAFRIEPGQFAYFGREHPHRLEAVRSTEYFSIHFLWSGPSATPVHPAYGIREADEDAPFRPVRLRRVAYPGFGSIELPHLLSAVGVEPLLQRIVNEYRQERPGYPAMLRAYLTELLTELLRSRIEGGAPDSSRRSRIGAALRAMRERPAKPWTVAELAGLCGYHPSYFTSLFSREMGRNPKQYLILERIRQAKDALLRGEAIEAIADRLGYGSIHYFSNNFKKETGLTPSEFRQRPHRGGEQ